MMTATRTTVMREDLSLRLLDRHCGDVILEDLGQHAVHDDLQVGVVEIEQQLRLLDEELHVGDAAVLRREVLEWHALFTE